MAKVRCGACYKKSKLKHWKFPNTIFAGGCPSCHGEFYDVIQFGNITKGFLNRVKFILRIV